MNTSAAKPSVGTPRHLYLIDGSAYIFRAFHALPPMTRDDGTPVNAVYGFTNMLLKLVEDALADSAADYFAVIFDTARTTFRNEIYADYKANRPPPPEELIPQFALVREATAALNLPSIELEGFEADDIIATLARRAVEAGAEVTIVSSDKDLMQLVNDHVTMLDPMKNRRIADDEVMEKFGVGPDRVIDVQALAGDSTDNVPGVPGIGIKTAAQLIAEYGDLDTLLARAEEIKQPKRRQNLLDNAELARISRDLVTLKNDVPLDHELDALALNDVEPEPLLAFLKAQGFKSILARMESRWSAEGKIEVADDTPTPADAAYALVQTEAQLAEWIAAAEASGWLAVDTETTSLDAMQAELVGLSLSTEPGRACYVPVGHRGRGGAGTLDLDGDVPEQIPAARAMELLKPLFENPAVLKVGHNLKYDMLVLRRYDATLTPIDDTMLLSFVLDAGSHGHGLDEITELHLGHTNIKFSEVAGKGKDQVTFDRVPLEKARDYAAEDADIAGRLHRLLKPRLAEERLTTVYETIERPLVPVLVEMESAGIKADRAILDELSRDFAGRIAAYETEIHALAGHPFTIGSPKQLGEVLFDEMGLDAGRKGKSGARSTSADILERLAAQGHELPRRVLDWRQLTKLKSTYTDALVEEINPETGRIHTSYAMAGAATGRLASTDPNLQNIPVRTEEGRKIRRAFVAEDGHKLVSLDYSQIELRLLAHVADIESLKQAFRDGIDIHALTASQVFGVPVEGMDPMVRRQAKAINFGIIYGISAFGLANQLGIARGEAAKYIETYFERYPGIREYTEGAKAVAREKGYVTTPFGRRIHIRGINEKNPAHRGFSERAAINAPLQGGAADVIKRAMVRIPEAMAAAKLTGRMLLQVHDELLFEVPEAEVDGTIDAVRKVMEGADRPALALSVPLVVDAGVADNWAEAH